MTNRAWLLLLTAALAACAQKSAQDAAEPAPPSVVAAAETSPKRSPPFPAGACRSRSCSTDGVIAAGQ